MYSPKTPAKPRRATGNYCAFLPDKMRSERHDYSFMKFGRFAEWSEHWKQGNDHVMRRFQRRQQRRLNRWLSDPNCPEWG